MVRPPHRYRRRHALYFLLEQRTKIRRRNQPAAGSHTVTAGSSGCSATATATIGSDGTLLPILAPHRRLPRQNNGAITVSASGGGSPFTFLWNNGQTGATANNLAPEPTPLRLLATTAVPPRPALPSAQPQHHRPALLPQRKHARACPPDLPRQWLPAASNPTSITGVTDRRGYCNQPCRRSLHRHRPLQEITVAAV
ncbi:MAG: SprB repeat-containing protein [Lewinellaceae bacterium]|nr:SprB repeat-containing protein [Lewinellaceae bacterium]